MEEIIELTEEEKDRAAARNGWAHENYTDKVKASVRNDLGLTIEDEVAILRKFCAKLLEIVTEIHGSDIIGQSVTDFIVYNANVEQQKIIAENKAKNIHGA